MSKDSLSGKPDVPVPPKGKRGLFRFIVQPTFAVQELARMINEIKREHGEPNVTADEWQTQHARAQNYEKN